MMDWYDGNHMSNGDWVAMTMIMIVAWGLLIGAAVMVFRGSANWRTPGTTRDPMAILDERFARGEIEREEYEARRAVLGGKV